MGFSLGCVQHVRFAEEPGPMLNIPGVFSGEGLPSNGALDKPSLSAEGPDGEFRTSVRVADISTRMGTRYFDSVVEGQSPERGRPPAAGVADAKVRGGREFFSTNRTAAAGRSPEPPQSGGPLPTLPSTRLESSPLRFRKGESLSGETVSVRVSDRDPTVRLGSEFFQRTSGGDRKGASPSASMKKGGSAELATPLRGPSPRRPTSADGDGWADPSVRLPAVSAFDLSPQLPRKSPFDDYVRLSSVPPDPKL